MVPEAYSEQSERLKKTFSKSFNFLRLCSDCASGTVNCCHQKLQSLGTLVSLGSQKQHCSIILCFVVAIYGCALTYHNQSKETSTNFKSSQQRCSIKESVLRNFLKSAGEHLCQSLFFNKVAGIKPAITLKKRLQHRCFLVNFPKFLKTPFLQNTSGRLLLKLIIN